MQGEDMTQHQTPAEMAEEIKRAMRASLMSNKVEAAQSANVDRLAAMAESAQQVIAPAQRLRLDAAYLVKCAQHGGEMNQERVVRIITDKCDEIVDAARALAGKPDARRVAIANLPVYVVERGSERFMCVDRDAAMLAAAQQVPAGWKLVPVEPTPEMLAAVGCGQWSGGPGADYRNMLAAAPEAPEARKPLTEEQIHGLSSDCYDGHTAPLILFARAIEHAHGIEGDAS
jgi:hypothetical protein